MSYLHGVEIKGIQSATISIQTVATAIIGIVGIAQKGRINEPILITNLKQAKDEFGADVNGTTIISALNIIFNNGGAVCIVVNVGDATKIATATDTLKKIKLINKKYATQVYEKTTSKDAGFVDFTSDILKGMELLLTTESEFGIKAKLLIAPGFSQVKAVNDKMISIANKLKAKAIIDIVAPSVSDALTARNTDFAISDNRAILCYPQVVRYNEDEEQEQLAGLSIYYAVGIAKRDTDEGYWHSPSSLEMRDILKTNIPVISSLYDSSADTNLLNAKAISTLFRSYSTGFKLWGNWTAAFPSNTELKSMIAPSRVADVIDESIQTASLNFMDKPINNALIDFVKNSINMFLNTLKSRGAIIDGECIFDKDKNPVTEIANGKLIFTYSFCPPASLDRLTFESYVDINYLKSIQ